MRNNTVYTLIFFTVFLCVKASAQFKFEKTYGNAFPDLSFSIQKITGGGFIVCGTSSKDTSLADTDIFLLKTDSSGDTVWTKTYGGNGSDIGTCVQPASDGGFIVSGITNSFGAGSDDMLLMKIKTNGDLAWLKTFGGASGDLGHYVQQTFDGGYVVAGHTDSYGIRGEFYVVRTDSLGDTLWTKIYGGAKHDHAFCVEQTSDSGLIIVGHTLSFGDTLGGFYIVKTNKSGDLMWSKAYGGSKDSYAYSVQQTFDGDYIIAGITQSFGAGGNDFYVVKTNGVGDTLWTRTYGGTGEDIANCIKQTKDGNFIITGNTSSFGNGDDNVCLVKIKPDGDTLWSRQFGGNNTEEGFSAAQTADGGFIICGDSKSFVSPDFDVYLVKTDSLGNTNCHQSNAPLIITRPPSFFVNALTDELSTATEIAAPIPVINSGTITHDACAYAGIKESVNIIEPASLNIYPNPNNGNFYLSVTSKIKNIKEIKILNNIGQVAYSSGNADTDYKELPAKEIHLKAPLPGIYFISVICDEKIFTSKVLVD